MSIKFPNLKRFFSLFLAAVMMVTLLAVNAHAANDNKITDYGDAYGHWAYEALTWAVDNGVMVGTSEDKLNPDGYLTRAQMAAMIDRLFGTYKSADIQCLFAKAIKSTTDFPLGTNWFIHVLTSFRSRESG
ncbi:S-layer homology domain-containing protein [Oscillospiraceae bacterium 21-37]